MDKLLSGYRRFRRDIWPSRRRLFEDLADAGQAPRALVISCADSRVDPGMIFDAAPGELFVVRNVASIVPPYAPDGGYHGTSAALEFAVKMLNVPDILVMGHGMCGGVRALLDGPPPEADFIGPWIDIAKPARDRALAAPAGEDRQRTAENEVIQLSIRHLLTFPWVASRAAEGKLTLTGAHFDIRTGELSLSRSGGDFVKEPFDQGNTGE